MYCEKVRATQRGGKRRRIEEKVEKQKNERGLILLFKICILRGAWVA